MHFHVLSETFTGIQTDLVSYELCVQVPFEFFENVLDSCICEHFRGMDVGADSGNVQSSKMTLTTSNFERSRNDDLY